MADFITSSAMWALSLIVCLLCVNGFISKVLDKQVDRVARFAIGFFMIVSGILLSRSNFLLTQFEVFPDTVVMQSIVRIYICAGMLLTIQSMLDEARKRYWWGALMFTVLVAMSAYLVFPYL